MDNQKPLAIITGGASGIGKACAQLLNEEYRIIIADMKGAKEAARELSPDAQGMEVDISDFKSCQSMAERIGEQGGVDVLVHCAGIMNGVGVTMEDLPVESWDKLLQVNLSGTYYIVKALTPYIHDHGRIVLISSRVGRTGTNRMDIHMTTCGHYCASKAGVNSITKSFALELAPRGIRVNAVAPGPIVTPLATPKSDEHILPFVPLGRRGTPLEIAKGVRFLCSDDSSYITGHILDINGGMNMF